MRSFALGWFWLRLSSVALFICVGGVILSLSMAHLGLQNSGQIVFESYRDGNYDIFALDLRLGLQVNLTRHPADDFGPARIRPDGTMMFVSDRDDDSGAELYLMPVYDRRSAVTWSQDTGNHAHPVWSPDGRRIVFVLGYGNIRIADARNAVARDLVYGFGPVWSPDGTRIIYYADRRDDLRADIFSIDVNSGQRQLLTTSMANDWSPAWSPDGESIAFVSARDGNAEIYVMDAQCSQYVCDTQSQRLTHDPANDMSPSWSPDGRWLVFHSDRTGTNQLYIMTADGEHQRQITWGDANNQLAVWWPVQ